MLNKYAQNLVTYTLDNGLKVFVYPHAIIPQVSMQLWYNVGSKDERRGEKGLAHFLEHMLFKGTETMSEVDMIQITQKLSGDCNAFTSQDYTGYLFNFPNHHWNVGFQMLADTMRNCTFKQDLLNSELSAVIQELKLYRDDYEAILEEEIFAAIFDAHPYHYPVIGYKQDLWNASRQEMVAFYHKHYVPNNATLVVVGDIKADEVISQAEHYFGSIKSDEKYKKQQHYFTNDISSKSVTLYRDVQQPVACVGWVVPGQQTKNSYLLDCLSWLIGNGKGSRLYKKIVDELQLATDLDCYTSDLFERGVFFIKFRPTNSEDIPLIRQIIEQEIGLMIEKGFTQRELLRAEKQNETDYLELFEDIQEIAHEIARGSLATLDPYYALTYLDTKPDNINEHVRQFLSVYCKPVLTHFGAILPIPETEHEYMIALQDASDQEDEMAMAARQRHTALEGGKHVHKVALSQPYPFHFNEHRSFMLSNECKVLYYQRTTQPTIDLVLLFKAHYYMDPNELQGLYNFVMAMLLEGTQNYPDGQLADEFETYGMSLELKPGLISIKLLSQDLEKALTLLDEMLRRPLLQEQALEKVRTQLSAQVRDYWDDSYSCVDQIAKETVYKNHPYAKNALGTLESLERITQKDVYNFYKAYLSPHGAMLSIVGDLQEYDLPRLLERTLGQWTGPAVADVDFPVIKNDEPQVIEKTMQRDQMALCFASLSIARTDPDYDAVLIFEEIFSGGSMSSKLFALREQSGLFYTIKGSLLGHADKQPGMVIIKTLVSLDKLEETKQRIIDTIHTTIAQLTDEEIQEAKNSLIAKLIDHSASNGQLARTFLFLERFALPSGYFNTRAAQLQSVTLATIKAAAQRILRTELLNIIQIGRIDELEK